MSEDNRIHLVQDRLAQSDRQDVRTLCRLSSTELLHLIESIIDSDSPFDEELFIAAQDLLTARVPIEYIEERNMPMTLELFHTKYADVLAKQE